jgi:hypothetical protein
LVEIERSARHAERLIAQHGPRGPRLRRPLRRGLPGRTYIRRYPRPSEWR